MTGIIFSVLAATYVVCHVVNAASCREATRLAEGLQLTPMGEHYWPSMQAGWFPCLVGWILTLEPLTVFASGIRTVFHPKQCLAIRLSLFVQPCHWDEAQRRLDEAYPDKV